MNQLRFRFAKPLCWGALALMSSCSSDTQFKGTSPWGGIRSEKATMGYTKAGDSKQETAPENIGTKKNADRGIHIPCSTETAIVGDTSSLNIPVVCSIEVPSSSPGFLDMDIVFVMDTTGSMRKYVDLVRRNLALIESHATKNGFKVQFGGVSYGDEIYDIKPLSDSSAAMTTAMLDSNPLWRPDPHRGGNIPEIGLAAIEKGMEILASGSGRSKTLVFYTDAPSKRSNADRESLASSFFVGSTAEKMRTLSKGAQSSGGIFRFATGTSCERGDAWFTEWPTPCKQVSELANSAGAKHIPIIFGQSNSIDDQDFIASVENKSSIVTTDCWLTAIKILNSAGKTVLPEIAISRKGEGLWSAPMDGPIAAGEYAAHITRTCPSGPMIQSAKIFIR